jgi:hypothetical protein
MYRIEYRSEDHPEFGYSHVYKVKCVSRIVVRKGKRRLEWDELGECDETGVLRRCSLKKGKEECNIRNNAKRK